MKIATAYIGVIISHHFGRRRRRQSLAWEIARTYVRRDEVRVSVLAANASRSLKPFADIDRAAEKCLPGSNLPLYGPSPNSAGEQLMAKPNKISLFVPEKEILILDCQKN